MKPVRLVLASLVGAVVIFAWGFLTHAVLPLGEMGMKNLPDPLTQSLGSALSEPGAYYFPPMNGEDEAAQEEWTRRSAAGPRGVVMFDPTGGAPMSLRQLGVEFLSGLGGACLLTLILVRAGAGLVGGAFLGAVAGVFAWLAIDASYWNWYRFPDAFVTAGLIEQGTGWLLVGAAVAPIVRARQRRAPA
jgi:hypothetical protein